MENDLIDPNHVFKDKICLQCKSITTKKDLIIDKESEDGEDYLVEKCPVCYEEKSVFSLQQLKEVKQFEEFLDRLEYQG